MGDPPENFRFYLIKPKGNFIYLEAALFGVHINIRPLRTEIKVYDVNYFFEKKCERIIELKKVL
jgi:hypothetical protein